MAKSDSEHRKRQHSVRRHAANLFFGWLGVVARGLHQLVLPLQLSPLGALLGHGRCSYPPELADKPRVRSTVHSIFQHVVILDMASAGFSLDEWAVDPTPMLADLPQHGARPADGEKNDDGK